MVSTFEGVVISSKKEEILNEDFIENMSEDFIQKIDTNIDKINANGLLFL